MNKQQGTIPFTQTDIPLVSTRAPRSTNPIVISAECAAEPKVQRRDSYHILAMARRCAPMCEQTITAEELGRSHRNPEYLMHAARVLAARLRPSQLPEARLQQLQGGTLEEAVEAVASGAMTSPALAWTALCGIGGHIWNRYGMRIENELI